MTQPPIGPPGQFPEYPSLDPSGAGSPAVPVGGAQPPYPPVIPAQPVAYGPLPSSPPAMSARKPGTDGFAIVALVLSLCGGWLLGLIFGIVALVRIKKSGEKGKGLAVAGIIVSSIGIAALAIGVVVAILTTATRDSSGEIVDSGRVSLEDLVPGDCVNDLVEGRRVTSLSAVPCSEPHDGEVFAVFNLPETSWPGESSVDDDAVQGCTDRLGEYSPAAADDETLELLYFSPTEQSWRLDDRAVVCLATQGGTKRTGSIRA
jgi:hypothetical protein